MLLATIFRVSPPVVKLQATAAASRTELHVVALFAAGGCQCYTVAAVLQLSTTNVSNEPQI